MMVSTLRTNILSDLFSGLHDLKFHDFLPVQHGSARGGGNIFKFCITSKF